MRQPYLGIYWTLPVNWAGFRDLPPSVEAAAAASKTIRYQRERVRRHVQDDGGDLIAEIAFMDTRTDRATDAVRDVLHRHAPTFPIASPTVLTVRFEDNSHWRPNPFIHHAASELGLDLIGLSPDPLLIDGHIFDPARHFATWRRRDATAMARLRLNADEALSAALATTPPGEGRWQTIANSLNAQHVRSIRGGAWTPENVRERAGRLAV